MKKVDRALVLVIILSLAAAWPFIFRASLPRETDAELHVFRAAELGYSLRELELYPRWAPDFYYGYGYPIFNYYAPLTYYLTNLFSLAVPGGAVFGSKAVFILTFLFAGTGAYALARLYAGSRAGVISASSYLFAPYIYIIDPHLRGDLAEFLALGFAPVALWACAAFHQTPTRRYLILSSAAAAALILSHNLLGLAFFGLLFGQWIWLAIVQRKPITTSLLLGAPLIVAVGLSAFFWLPVALESSAVQLHNLIGPGHFDFREHFLTPFEIFAPSRPLDLGSLNPAFHFNVGLAQWILGIIGLVGIVHQFRSKQPDGLLSAPVGVFWVICTIILLGLMLQISLPLWESMPLMSFFQFPWRMLGPAALCLAVVGGYSASLLPTGNVRVESGLFAAAVAIPLVSALPVWSPPAWEPFGPTDQSAMLEFELGGFALGTTSTGDFIPSTVDVVPQPAEALVDSYRGGQPVDRVDYQRLPDNTSVTVIEQRPTSDAYRTKSDDAFTLTLFRFMFPGWKATVDGVEVDIRHTEPEGFIQIPIPSGTHEVRIWFGLTEPRILASSLSIISLVALVAVSAVVPASRHSLEFPSLPDWDVRSAVAATTGILLIALVGSLIGIWQPRSHGLIAIPAEMDTHHYFEGGIDLIGYDIGDESLHPGDELPLTLYWKAREAVPANYQVFVHLVTVPEHIWGQSDKLNPGDYPTTRWSLDKYLRDPHSFAIPLGTPPGTYEIRVGLWNRSTGYRQLLLEEDGTILGDSLKLPTTVEIEPALTLLPIESLPLDVVIESEVVEGITLLGADLDPNGEFLTPLGNLAVRLYWLSKSSDLPAYQVGIRLLDASGVVIASSQAQITDGLFPTDNWESDIVIRDIHTIWFDESIPTGRYTIEVALIPSSPSDSVEWIQLTEILRQ